MVETAEGIRQIEETRRAGREFLARKPESFGGAGRSISAPSSGVTEVSPGVFAFIDPKTGKRGLTSSREFAEAAARGGKPEFTKEFQEKFRTGAGIGSGTPSAFAREEAGRLRAFEKETGRISITRGRINVLQQKLDLGRLSKRQAEFTKQKIKGLRSTIGGGRAAGIRTSDLPQQFEKRQIDVTREGIPVTAFFNIQTGQQATFKQEAEFRQQEVEEREIGRQPTIVERKIIKPITRVLSAADKKIQNLLNRLDKAVATEDTALIQNIQGKLNILEEKRLQIRTAPKDREGKRSDLDKTLSTFTTPQGVRTLAGIPAELTLRGGEISAEFLEPGIKRIPIVGEALTEKLPITREQVRDVLTDVFLIAAFSPFIKTATAQQTKVKVKVKEITDKEKLKKLIELRKKLSRSSEAKVKIFVKKQIQNINRNVISPTERAKQLRNLELFVREARGQIVIQDGKIIPIIDLNKISAIKTNPALLKSIQVIKQELPIGVKLERLPELLSAVSVKNRLISENARKKEKERSRRAKLTISERLEEKGVFGLPSVFAGTGQFERTEGTAVRLAQDTKEISQLLQQTDLSRGQIVNLRQRMDNLQRELLLNKNVQLSLSDNKASQLTRQLQQTRQKEKSLTRQLSSTRNIQRTAQLTRQLSRVKTLQKTLSKSLSTTKLRQRSLTKQVNKSRLRLGIKKPKVIKKPLLFGVKKPVKKVKIKPILKKKNFQVFVRKKGKDVFFKSFDTKPKARKGIRRQLAGTLRASGFIFDKKKGVKVKPVIKNPKVYRLGKKDKFRLVEKRNQRLTKGTKEISEIQQAKRVKKPFNGKSKFKKVKLIRRKK